MKTLKLTIILISVFLVASCAFYDPQEGTYDSQIARTSGAKINNPRNPNSTGEGN